MYDSKIQNSRFHVLQLTLLMVSDIYLSVHTFINTVLYTIKYTVARIFRSITLLQIPIVIYTSRQYKSTSKITENELLETPRFRDLCIFYAHFPYSSMIE